MRDKGVFYIAKGQKHLEEATYSAKSVKNKMPDIPIILFTDKDYCNTLFDSSSVKL